MHIYPVDEAETFTNLQCDSLEEEPGLRSHALYEQQLMNAAQLVGVQLVFLAEFNEPIVTLAMAHSGQSYVKKSKLRLMLCFVVSKVISNYHFGLIIFGRNVFIEYFQAIQEYGSNFHVLCGCIADQFINEVLNSGYHLSTDSWKTCK